MATYGFNEGDAKRIGRTVRLSERFPPTDSLGAFAAEGAAPGVRLMLGKAVETTLPSETAIVTIHVGDPLAGTAMTVVARNTIYPLMDTAATACVSNNGWGWHVVEGVQQLWCGEIEEEWPIGEEKTITLHGCNQQATAVNEITPVHRPDGAEVVVAYTDDKWRVVNAETYHTRPGVYNAASEWLRGTNKVVTFNTGGTANVRNDGPSIGLWSGTNRSCVAAYEYGQWSLVEAETYYVRRGTFTGTWDKDTTKTVTLTNGGSVTALNPFGNVGAVGATRDCAVAYEDGTWFLIAAECE